MLINEIVPSVCQLQAEDMSGLAKEATTQVSTSHISATEFFTEENYSSLVKYCRQRLRLNVEDAEDVTQSTLLKVMRTNNNGVTKPEDDWRRYVFTALYHTYLNEVRKRRNQREISLDDQTVNPEGSLQSEPSFIVEAALRAHAESISCEREQDALTPLAQVLEKVLAYLNAEELQLLALWRDGLNDQEIAMELQIPVESIKYKKDLLKRKVRYRVRAEKTNSARTRDIPISQDSHLLEETLAAFWSPPGGSVFHLDERPRYCCDDPSLDRLIDLYGYNFLIETLRLRDDLFEGIYGVRVPQLERQLLHARLQRHYAICSFCQKASETLEDDLVVVEDALLSFKAHLVVGACTLLSFASLLAPHYNM